MAKEKYNNIQLVKTDYDDFKTMRFFIDQERKAEAMLKEVAEFKQSFIQSKLVSYEDWYKKHINPEADHKEIFNAFDKIHRRWIAPSCSDTNCVVFNGDIKFVSSTPRKYSLKISDDNKEIIFYFSDDYYKPSRSGFGKMEQTSGQVILTYDIDTNELIKYERPWK